MSGHTCLVVDDSRVVREAEDGRQALLACQEELPELVLLDWNMPVMNGLEFLVAARKEFGPDRPIVVLCTTENAFERIVEALDAGAQEYVMKPFDAEILGAKLTQVGLIPAAEEPA
jgi:two-component system chemotaxis response regulator CheY